MESERNFISVHLSILSSFSNGGILVDFFTVRSGNEDARCLNSKVRDLLFNIRELKRNHDDDSNKNPTNLHVARAFVIF